MTIRQRLAPLRGGIWSRRTAQGKAVTSLSHNGLELKPSGTPEELRLQRLNHAVSIWLEPGEVVSTAATSDISPEGHFAEVWLVLTDRRVLILESLLQLKDKLEDLSPSLLEELPLVLVQDIFLQDIVEVQTVDLIGNSALIISEKTGDENQEEPRLIEAARYSRSVAHRFSEFTEALQKAAPSEEARERAPGEEETSKPVKRCQKCDRPFPPGGDSCPYCLNRGAVLWRILAYIKPYKGPSLLALVLTIVVTLLSLTPPYLSKILMDDVLAPRPGPDMLTSHRLHILTVLCWIYVARWVLGAAISAGRSRLMAWLGQRIVFDLRVHLCSHVQSQSLSYFDKRHVGAVMSRVMNDTSAINQFLVDGLQNFMINILTLLLIGMVLFATNWKLAVLVLAPTPLMILLTRWFTRRVQPIYRRYYGSLSAMNGVLATAISGIRVVKSFAQEQREIQRFSAIARDFYDANLASNWLGIIYSPALTILTGIGSVVIWAVGGWQVIHHELSAGTVLMFTGYMWQFFAPVQALCNLSDQLQNTAVAAERIFQLLDTHPEVRDQPEALAPPMNGRVQFEHVSFSYDEHGSGPRVLNDIHFTAEPGQLIGLVGHSGSGKSSMVNLLLRFYDVTEGRILIDGIDVRELDSRGLREQVGMVLQEPFLFSGTIAENIAYGCPDMGPDEIIEAARAANAHKFILKFPDAYDTEVGERGVKLSGGEKQRISIARAILNDPRILILDEATSAVDTETEALIQEAMERLMNGRTTFAIAHRLSTLKNADMLIVLDHGKIVEMGTHQELLAREDGVYAKLVRIQTEMSKTTVLNME